MPTAVKRSIIMGELDLETDAYALATIHRAENVDDPKVLSNFIKIFESSPLPVILPLHPRTVKNAKRFGLWERMSHGTNIGVIDPVGYWDFLVLMANCGFIMTDSGGIQEEATAPNIRKKCFVLRTSTERQEAVDAGFAELVGVKPKPVVNSISQWSEHGASVPARKSPFGDGNVAERTIEIIKEVDYC